MGLDTSGVELGTIQHQMKWKGKLLESNPHNYSSVAHENCEVS